GGGGGGGLEARGGGAGRATEAAGSLGSATSGGRLTCRRQRRTGHWTFTAVRWVSPGRDGSRRRGRLGRQPPGAEGPLAGPPPERARAPGAGCGRAGVPRCVRSPAG